MSDERNTRDGGDDEVEVSADAASGDVDAAGRENVGVSRPSGKRPRRGAKAAATSGSIASSTNVATVRGAAKSSKAERPKENIVKRLIRFIREVVAELRKVIWPNRKQMITYTSVVLVFIIFMVAFISGLDIGFIKGVTWLFG